MYTELIEKLGELGFVVSQNQKKVPKYDQYTGEVLPDKLQEIKLEKGVNSITLYEDKFYIGNISLFWTRLSLCPYSNVSMRVCNPDNYAVQEIYDLAKLMLDKVQERNKDV